MQMNFCHAMFSVRKSECDRLHRKLNNNHTDSQSVSEATETNCVMELLPFDVKHQKASKLFQDWTIISVNTVDTDFEKSTTRIEEAQVSLKSSFCVSALLCVDETPFIQSSLWRVVPSRYWACIASMSFIFIPKGKKQTSGNATSSAAALRCIRLDFAVFAPQSESWLLQNATRASDWSAPTPTMSLWPSATLLTFSILACGGQFLQSSNWVPSAT